MDKQRLIAMSSNHPVVADVVDRSEAAGGTADVKVKRVIVGVLKYLVGPHPSHPESVRVEELAALLKFVLAVVVEFGVAGEIEFPDNTLPGEGGEAPDQELPEGGDGDEPDQELPGASRPKPTPHKR